jgi:hypothetical protein
MLKRTLRITVVSTAGVFGLFVLAVFLAGPIRPLLAASGQTQPNVSLQEPASAAAQADPATLQTSTFWVISTIAFVLLVTGLFAGYMFYLQRKFFQACKEANELALFMRTPAGLPAGTVRSIITLIILTVSLYIVALSMFDIVTSGIPEILSALLTAVIGFYFGSRTAGGGGEAGTAVEQARKAQEAAVAKQKEGEASLYLKKVRKNLAMVKRVLNVLPPSLRTQFEPMSKKLQDGLLLAEKLLSTGKVSEAAEEAKKAFELFVKDNPVRTIVERAVKSFARVAGNLAPPLALVSSIVGVSSTLVGTAYAKWKARILKLPFDPAVTPLKLVDADTGFALLLANDIFKKAFAPEMQGMDRPFLEKAVSKFLRGDVEELWGEFKDRFESREEFEDGLQQFREAAASLELKAEIEPGLLAEAGGFDTVMSAIDQIQADPTGEARADLDLLIETVEELRRANEPVRAIFEKVKQEISQ